MQTIDYLQHKLGHICKLSINNYFNKRTMWICTHQQIAKTTIQNNNKIKKS